MLTFFLTVFSRCNRFDKNVFSIKIFQVIALFATSYAEELAGWYPVKEQTEDRVKRDASELVDLHNGEFCVDVSEWGDVEYTPLEREQCDSTFEKKCEMKTEQVVRLIQNDLGVFISYKLKLQNT